MEDIKFIVEIAVGVALGGVLAWWIILTLQRWLHLVHATPCWPMTSSDVEDLASWETWQSLTDAHFYLEPVQWARNRLRRKWRRHCETLKEQGWSTEKILGLRVPRTGTGG
jgi:hypothetical protein